VSTTPISRRIATETQSPCACGHSAGAHQTVSGFPTACTYIKGSSGLHCLCDGYRATHSDGHQPTPADPRFGPPLSIRLAAIGSCDYISVSETGAEHRLLPVTVIVQGTGGFRFHDYLTADEAEALGDALCAVALAVRERARGEVAETSTPSAELQVGQRVNLVYGGPGVVTAIWRSSGYATVALDSGEPSPGVHLLPQPGELIDP
jgi:hypothetical protein